MADAPDLQGLEDLDLTTYELSTPQLIAPDVHYTDPDGDSDGTNIVVSHTGFAGDVLGILSDGSGPGGVFWDNDGTLYYEGNYIGLALRESTGDLSIYFFGQTPDAVVETVIEHITLTSSNPANVNDRVITILARAANGAYDDYGFVEVPGAVDTAGFPAFAWFDAADLDGDGDVDLAAAANFGSTIGYFENVGDATTPAFVERTGAANPFAAIDEPLSAAPRFADIDGDSDFDLFVGNGYGGEYYENTGDASTPVFTQRFGGDNPFAGLGLDGYHTVFGDMDNDGDLDLFSKTDGQFLDYFENTGDSTNPVFTQRTGADNPMDGVRLQDFVIGIGDVDNDGDLDLVASDIHYNRRFYENVGDASEPEFVRRRDMLNPFEYQVLSNFTFPVFADVDGDGDIDMLAGDYPGLKLLEYLGEQPTLVINVTASNFPTVAENDAITLAEAASFAGDLFANNGSGLDRDLESDPFAVTAVNGVAASVGSTITLASGALLTVQANGQFAYDQNGAFDSLGQGATGADSFTYAVTGGDTATVTITINGVAGTGGNDVLVGDAAGNTLDGGAGDDDIRGRGAADSLLGGTGDDFIDGEDGDDVLRGGDGADYLRGGAGSDEMHGGAGDDFYAVEDASDTPIELDGEGTDLVWSRIDWTLGAFLENLTLGAAAGEADGAGNGLANLITGNAAANTLTGLGGGDTLLGLGGRDILVGGDGADSLDGGLGDDALDGGADADDLIGGAGHDTLNGGAGGDDMVGGAGNDLYIVDDLSDAVTEDAGAGTDRVESSVTFTLGANLEHLTLTGGGDIDGTGNALRNTLIGNGGDNVLSGGDEIDTLRGGDGADTLRGDAGGDLLDGEAGADTLLGGLGNDSLAGSGGDDTLQGDAGNDKLTGGLGADRFVFTAADMKSSLLGQVIERDEILDLAFADGDRIDLSGIDANLGADGDQAFVWAAKFTRVAGQAVLKYAPATDITTLELDIDGDGKADLRIAIAGDHAGSSGNLYTGAGDPDGGWVL